MSDHDDGGRPEGSEGERPHPSGAPERPGETFKKGMGLLWQAARSAADEIKREVDKGGVNEAIQRAGRDIEDAANQAAQALEGFIGRAGSGRPRYTDRWPPPDQPDPASDREGNDRDAGSTDKPRRESTEEGDAPEGSTKERSSGSSTAEREGRASDDGPPLDNTGQPPDLEGDGGTDPTGERRDMRIQVDGDDSKR